MRGFLSRDLDKQVCHSQYARTIPLGDSGMIVFGGSGCPWKMIQPLPANAAQFSCGSGSELPKSMRTRIVLSEEDRERLEAEAQTRDLQLARRVRHGVRGPHRASQRQ